MSDSEDICGLCGQPGADKIKHPCHWPGEQNPEGQFVHAECEQQECARALEAFRGRVGDAGVKAFLKELLMKAEPPQCAVCGSQRRLKRGWTMALYCSEKCERDAVARLHHSMPGGPSPHKGWMPSHISREIAERWEGETQ